MTIRQRIGLLGGSFNPVHYGHLIMAENARDQLDLDEVLLAPAGNPPHKRDQVLASIPDRLAMLRLAIAGNDAFRISELDLHHDDPSFTWRLLERMRQEWAGAEVWFIMGGDSLADFPTWARPEYILDLARLAVVDRPGVELDQAELDTIPGLRSRIDRLQAPLCAVSSTDIRRRIGHGESVRYLLPDAVRDYIGHHDLYRDGNAS